MGGGATVTGFDASACSVKRGAARVPRSGRGMTGGFPIQLLFGSEYSLGSAGAGLAIDPAPLRSAGSPGKPDPRGARSPPSWAARALSLTKIASQSRRTNAARLTLIMCRALMLSEVMLPACGPQPRLIEGIRFVE